MIHTLAGKVMTRVSGKTGDGAENTPAGRFTGWFEQIIVPAVVFTGSFLFLLFHINPAILYSSNGFGIHTYVTIMHAPDASSYTDLLYRNLFILELTPEYFREIVLTPGGWTRFAVTLLIYACHFPVAGAFILTALAFFCRWIFTQYIPGTGGRRPFILGFIPAFFILTICAWYELSYCAFLLPVAGALAVAVIYQHLRPAPVLTTVLRLSACFWIAWYLMAWGGLLVLVFILIHELFTGRSAAAPVAAAAAVNGALFFLIDARVIPLKMTVRWSDFMILSGLPLAVIGFFPFCAIILAGLSRFRRLAEGRAAGMVRGGFLMCGMITAAVWLYREPVNRDTRIVARTVSHVITGQWDAILQEKTDRFFAGFPQKAGLLQVFMMHAVDHALCRTGRLGDRLLTFPQAVFSYDPLLMLQSMGIHSYANWLMILDLTMDLGMVNTAEKIAGEMMENMGPYPEILYRRALVQVAMGNREAAAVYLGRLAHMPFHRTEARLLLRSPDNGRALLSEKRIAVMETNKDTVDYFLNNNTSSDVMLRYLLQSNPGNKAAYDYLMTYCLLYDRLDMLSVFAPAAPSFGYAVLPRYWEEALCLFQSRNMLETSTGLSFSGIRQETIDRFFSFTRTWMAMKDTRDAPAKLAHSFGDSYFFYSIFRYSPGMRHE